MPEPQPGLPLGVRERRTIRLQELLQRVALTQIGMPSGYGCHRWRFGHRTGHVAHQVDDAVAILDVGVEHLQCFIAGHDEVLLHLYLHVLASQQVAKPLPITQKLGRYRGEEQLDARHLQVMGATGMDGGSTD